MALSSVPAFARTVEFGEHSLTLVGGTSSHGNLATIVGRLKYHGIRGLAEPLAQLANRGVELMSIQGHKVDVLVPIPLFGRRKRERGFNQALLIAQIISQTHMIPVYESLLSRERDTGQQAKIESGQLEDRLRNVRDGFRARKVQETKLRIGLIDDLITTGATMMAAATALRDGGWTVSWAVGAGLVGD